MANNNIGASATSNAVLVRVYLITNIHTNRSTVCYYPGARELSDDLGGEKYNTYKGKAYCTIEGVPHVIESITEKQEQEYLSGSCGFREMRDS